MRNSKFIGMFKAGQEIGRWTVKNGMVEFNPKSRAFIEVECNCGNSKWIECSALARNKSLRCEKCNYSSRGRAGEQNPNYKGVGIIPKTTLDKVERKASRFAKALMKESGFPAVTTNTVSLRSAAASSAGASFSPECVVSGRSITPEVKISSIVRYDTSKGYDNDNLAWVSAEIAPLVEKMGVTSFINMCQEVVNYQSQSVQSLKGE